MYDEFRGIDDKQQFDSIYRQTLITLYAVCFHQKLNSASRNYSLRPRVHNLQLAHGLF